jgi:hypothetical protein
MQSSGDHQMQHQPEFVFETERDPFPDSAQLNNLFSLDSLKRWIGGPQQERADDSNVLKSFALNTLFQRFEVNGYVRQFGHLWKLVYWVS